MELCESGTSVTFDSVSIERQRIAQLVAHRQGKVEVALLPETVQHVEYGAAGRFVGLEEHDVGVRLAGAKRGFLSVRGREDGTSSWLNIAGRKEASQLEIATQTVCGLRSSCLWRLTRTQIR